MTKADLEKKIEKINSLLEDDKELVDYIENIDIKEVEITREFNNKILTKCYEKNQVIRGKKKFYYTDIIRIVACTIFVLVLSMSNLYGVAQSSISNIASEDVIGNTSMYLKINEKMKILSENVISHNVFNKGEKR